MFLSTADDAYFCPCSAGNVILVDRSAHAQFNSYMSTVCKGAENG